MAQETCPTCSGLGSWTKTRSVSNFAPDGGPMWRTEEYRETCYRCAGTGSVYVQDRPREVTAPRRKGAVTRQTAPTTSDRTAGTSTQPLASKPAAARTPARPLTPEEADERFGTYLSVIVVGSAFYVLFVRYSVNITAAGITALAIMVACALLLTRLKRVTRFLRYTVAVAFIALLLAGAIYLVVLTTRTQ